MAEEKQKVVVAACDVNSYLERGYVRCVETVEQHVGQQMWGLLPPADRVGLELMEIPKSKHIALNSPPKRYALAPHMLPMWSGVHVAQLDLLENDPNEDAVVSYGSGAEFINPDLLFDSRRDCMASSAPRVREQIEAHRAAIRELEKFLMAIEAPLMGDGNEPR